MMKRTSIFSKRVDPRNISLHRGTSMVLGSKGSKPKTRTHRSRMPWMEAKEFLPYAVLNRKDKSILEGKHIQEEDHIDRSSQKDPLEILEGAVALYKYNTSNGKNLFQLASQLPYDGRGLQFYRKEWKEGTYDKHITLSSVEFDRDGNKGTAYGYVTFHGESSLKPIRIENAEHPGWLASFDEAKVRSESIGEEENSSNNHGSIIKNNDRIVQGGAHILGGIVQPPPSVGTEIPVDPQQYKLKAYPFYDPPNPTEFVERLLKDRGVLPDPPMAEGEENNEEMGSLEDTNDGSVPHKAAAQ